MNQLAIISLFYKSFSYHVIVTLLFVGFATAKAYLIYLIYNNSHRTANAFVFKLLLIPIVSYLIGEIASIFSLFGQNILQWTLVRIAWNMQPLQFYAQILFIKSLALNKCELQTKKLFYAFFVCIFFPILLIFFDPTNNTNYLLDSFFDLFCMAGLTKRLLIKIIGYSFLILTLCESWKKTSKIAMPHILKLHLRIFFMVTLVPLFPDTLSIISDVLDWQYTSTFNLIRILDLFSVASFTFSLLFFARRIYHLRFLNMTERVVAGVASQLTEEEMIAIKQTLCQARNSESLSEIHTDFFKKLINIAPERVVFHLRNPEGQMCTNIVAEKFEQFIQKKPNIAIQFFVEDSLLVYDELAFTHFYQYSDARAELLQFLQEINAAVVIPLKYKDQFFGAIVITKDSKKEELFSKSVQMHMQLYGTFVTYALLRLENISYYTLLEKYKAQSLALFETNQKNARFHETVMSFLKSDATKRQGILLYKNSVFSCMNEIAENLLQVNLNTHQGHPVVKAVKELVRRAQAYEGSQKIIEKNNAGIDLYFQTFSLKKEGLLILVSPADVTHLLSIEQALVQPTDIDYSVFLYSTKEGQAITAAFPGKGNFTHQANVRLLKTLLSKKAMLFDVHYDDMEMMVEVIKKVTHKTVVKTVDCLSMSPDEVASVLFGTQLFADLESKVSEGLFYALDDSGIIHIANAHQLDQKIQKMIVCFLKTGKFSLYKAEVSKKSDVTILFSSPRDLGACVKNNLFSVELYEYIKDAVITVPNLLQLPFAEVVSCAKEFQKQLISDPAYYHLFGFSAKELDDLDMSRPESYFQMRRRITAFIKQHKAQAIVPQETTVKRAAVIIQNDDILLDAARRGKEALKDRYIMCSLWERLKNQTRIAELLDVDRSSVHRRLKAYKVNFV